MAEQTEEKGSVVLPLLVGAGAGVGTHHLYTKSANKLAIDALDKALPEGAKIPPEALKTAAQDVVAADKKLAESFVSAKVMQEEGRIANVTSAKIERLTAEGAKGYNVTFTHPEGTASTFTVNKLKGEAAKLFKDEDIVKELVGDDLKTLTANGKGSWVAKTAANVEQEAAKTLRKSDIYKKAGGGITATFSHMTGGGKATLIGAGAVAAIGLGMGVKNMFGGPNTSRVEAERAASPAEASPAR
jgi:hypothetical protein